MRKKCYKLLNSNIFQFKKFLVERVNGQKGKCGLKTVGELNASFSDTHAMYI